MEIRIHKEDPLSEHSPHGPIGAVLADRFRIDRRIGTGGMATVYEATDAALGRTVAVKLFRSDSLDAAGPERQSGEIALLASLNHFALVTLFDAGSAVFEGSPRTFIVMEFVDGPDLRTRLLGGPMQPGEVAEMGADLAEALHYVHARGIIHRDVKPANVLLTASEFTGRSLRAKLADFGIARLLDESRLTATGTMIGTASYLSPEQALGTALGPPTDVYSLGLVLLECLTGERAYSGTAVESAMARLQRQPAIPAGLGSAWTDLLAAMTYREPADRPTASDVAVALRALASTGAGLTGAGSTSAVGFSGPAGDASPTPLPDDSTAAMAATQLADTARGTSGLADATPGGTGTARTGLGGTGSADTGPGDREPTPTLLLPAGTAAFAAGGPATAATTVMTAPKQPAHRAPITPNAPSASPARRGRRSRRARLLIGSIVLAAVAVIAVLAIVLWPGSTEPPMVAPDYPAVEGPLGTHLQELQESVTP